MSEVLYTPCVPQTIGDGEKRINLKVSKELHYRLKLLAVKRETTLQGLIEQLLESGVEEAERAEARRT